MNQSNRGDPSMTFNPGLSISLLPNLRYLYGTGVFGPEPEYRHLDAIRKSLRDPDCSGPDPVYSILMDVGREEHRGELHRRMLLFGVVAYATGRLGCEPVRSQGHIHAVAPHSGWSPPEVFEIWQGRAIVYAQERASDDPGQCVAVEAGPGQKVVVPPGWAHCVINAAPNEVMLFGALCDRQYGFDYRGVRAHGGLAWFPLLEGGDAIRWESNPRYAPSTLSIRGARSYPELGLLNSEPLYEQFARSPESVQWVSEPARLGDLWPDFEP
jgi:glucose-6-phosphate isomerase, archaeal